MPNSELLYECVQEFALFFANVLVGFRESIPAASIDFRNLDSLPGTGRPFNFACVAHKLNGVAVSLKGPCDDDLSAFLSHGTKLDKIAGRYESSLLLKLTLRCYKWIFVSFVFAFRKGSRALIFLGPKRPPGMNEEDFDLAFAFSIHEQTGAAFRSFCH